MAGEKFTRSRVILLQLAIQFSLSFSTFQNKLEEDVTFFAVLTQVQPLHFVISLHAQAHRGIQNLEQDKCAHNCQSPRNSHGHDLANEQAGIAIDKSHGVAASTD